ncbi:MAG: hypothetical protein Kow0090_10310 [Myxococcota bacterium]
MTQTVSTVVPLIREQILNDIAVIKDNPDKRFRTLLSLFPMVPGAGENIKWPVNHSGITGSSFNPETDSYQNPGEQSYSEAILPWKYINVTLKISGRAQDVAEGALFNDGNLTAMLVEEAARDLMMTLETQLKGDGTGNEGKDIDGIQAAVSASGTYAGIDRAVYTWWQSHINDVQGAWSEAEMQESLEALLDSPRNGQVNLGVTGPTQWHKIANVLKSQNQYLNTTQLAAGATAIVYDGVPIVPISGYPNDRLDLINTDDFSIVVIRDVKVVELARTSDNEEYAVSFGCNLRCRNPRAQGALVNLT